MKYIIMCGGNYKKFKTPKQLLKVNDEVIVERTIRLLRENGIKDIAVSTNDKRFNYLDVEILNNKDNQFLYYGENETKNSNNSWLKAYYLIDEPVCYLHGDVYFSDEAIKTIVETKVKDTMFFCVPDEWDVPKKDIRCAGGREPLAYKVQNNKLFNNAIKDLLNMIDEGKFKNAKCPPLAWTVYKYINGLELSYNAQWFGDWNNIFQSKGDYIMINDYTNDVDDIKDVDKIERYLKFKEGNMIKVEVIERFTLGDFKKLKNIIRKGVDNYGELFVGDIFECDEKMANYLTKDNKLKKPFVKVLEVIPEKKPIKIEEEDVKTIAKEVNKITKKTIKRKTSKK